MKQVGLEKPMSPGGHSQPVLVHDQNESKKPSRLLSPKGEAGRRPARLQSAVAARATRGPLTAKAAWEPPSTIGSRWTKPTKSSCSVFSFGD